MTKKTDSVASPDFAIFVLGLEQKYGVTLDEILEAVARFGYNRGKVQSYFEVQSYLKKNNLPLESVGSSMVNHWFPA
ncbi:MAG: hypothetical protein JO301_07235 [Chitinophagaceae bacterium]|nr:hypothetical protein [Chitinophagaceae bacterium]